MSRKMSSRGARKMQMGSPQVPPTRQRVGEKVATKWPPWQTAQGSSRLTGRNVAVLFKLAIAIV